jgi:molecular chaperone GrpE
MAERTEDTLNATEGAQAADEQQPQGESPEAQLAVAQAEAAEYKDRFLRERAEMENFRKRQERITNDRMQRFKRDLLEKVLEVTDNLERAMQYESTMDANSLRQTLRMLQSQLNAVLAGEGLTPIAAVGQSFDPHVHEAIETVASEEHPEGAVVNEVRKGYMLGNDLLRPARVTVSAGAKE